MGEKSIELSGSASDSLEMVQTTFSATSHSMRIDLQHAAISVTNGIDPAVLRAALEVLKDA